MKRRDFMKTAVAVPFERILCVRAILAECINVAVCSAAFAGNPAWDDPSVNSEGRLEARAYAPVEGDVLPLNGIWRFAWEGSADGRLASCDPSLEDLPFSIDVPSCVETRGWGVPHYVNIKYPHPMTPPKIDPKYNPTMIYRRTFSVPESWRGKRAVLRFEGVASCCEVWLNGKRAGYFEDSRLPSEFDVTKLIVLGAEGLNSLSVRVRKWCDGSYLEDQDMIRYAGIFRDVKLYALPIRGIRDYVFTTIPDAAYRIWTCRLSVEAEPDSPTVSATLLDAAGGKVGEFVDGTLSLTSPRLWSDEDPYLHVVEMRCGDDVRRVKVGIREIGRAHV